MLYQPKKLCGLLVALWLVVTALAAPALESESEEEGKIWAVLIAGSKSYGNYRHQADVCHAYHIFHRHGIPDSNIIVMMYDDIAYNKMNPKQGVILNKLDGPNVYQNVLKDYTGDDVTPENFLHVLTGNKKAMKGKGSGKVLESGPNDHVFINFVDHGATGIIGFPNNVLYADDLIKALKTMHKKKMYKKLVFYLEACESGSMFDKILPDNINIFATTAANPKESSYACYNDHAVDAYLGDEYSVSWMEDIDSEENFQNLTTETLLTQYNNVVKRVKHSHPSMYGKTSLDTEKVEDYVGNSDPNITLRYETLNSLERFKDAVSSRGVALRLLETKIEKMDDEDRKAELRKRRDELIAGRQSVDELFSRTLGRINGVDQKAIEETHQPLSLEMMPCYKTVVNYFTNNCVNINENTYALKHLYKFANLCGAGISADIITKAVADECTGALRGVEGIS